MFKILVLTVTLGITSADIGLKLRYQVPQTSYGVPSYPIGTNGGYNTGFSGYNYKQPSQAFNGASSSYNQQNAGYQGTNGNSLSGFQSSSQQPSSLGISNGNQYYLTPTTTTQSSNIGLLPPYQNNNKVQGQYQSFNNYQQSSNYESSNTYQEYYNTVQQPAQVFKHFYVHAAPEEPEEPKIRQPIVLPPPQKHYKIIFIKTPSQPAPPTQVVPIPQQNEEKTIVYVLVNKPEQMQEIVIPKVEQKPPSKPEVYFIKYNSKDGSQAVINNIVNDYNKGYESANVGDETIGTVDGVTPINSAEQEYANIQGSHSSTSVGTAGATGATGLLGASGIFASSTESTTIGIQDNYNTISTSQSVPFETYGPPKFRA